MKRRFLDVVILLAMVAAGTGCKVLLPAHPNSNARKGEAVRIEMLGLDDMRSYAQDYQIAFDGQRLPESLPVKQQNKVLPLVAAAAASAVVGFAVDYVQKELKDEASLYEAQFGTTIAEDKFWVYGTNNPSEEVSRIQTAVKTLKTESKTVGTNQEPTVTTDTTVSEERKQSTYLQRFIQNYYGFRVSRSVPDTTNAFVLVCGIAPSSDQQLFKIAPLYLETEKAKAKVLGDVWWTYLLPWVWPGKFIKTDGHHIDTKVDIEIDGYWKDKDQQLKITKLAAIPLNFQGYDIGTPIPLTASGQRAGTTNKVGKLKTTASGWLLSVPFSLDAAGKPVLAGESSPFAGAFTLKATVTEKDPSNAKQGLEQASELVGQQKQTILEQIPK